MIVVTRTVKFRLPTLDKDEFRSIMYDCSHLFDDYTTWAYRVKSYNKNICHKETYQDLKDKYPEIKIALLQSVRDVALESVKRGKFKCKQPKAKKCQSLRLNSYSYTLRGKLLSLIGKSKRHKMLLDVPDVFEKYFTAEWTNKGATLVYDKRKKEFCIHVVFVTDKTSAQNNDKFLGLDRGLYNLITDSNGKNIKANKIRKIRRRYLYNKKKLQQKGTRSAKKKLKNLSGREKRFMKDVNHVITKNISKMDYGTFVLEDLSNILKKKKGKKMNKWLRDWAFYQFQTFLEYKCDTIGKKVCYIDPRYTSQKCNHCGKIDKKNRNKSHYKCACGYSCHADYNAAKNIRDNYILSLNFSSNEQAAVNQPIEPEEILGSSIPSWGGQLTEAMMNRNSPSSATDTLLIELKQLQLEHSKLKNRIEDLRYWRDISECDCSSSLPQGGCLRCDLDRILGPPSDNIS